MKANWIEIVIGIILFLLFLAFTVTIKRNSENIFFSMRSSNLMILTNILIFLSIITYILNDMLYDKLKENYFSTFYFIFQISAFFALILRYFRLYLSCKNTYYDKIQIDDFEPKSYHYEYFYVRILAIFIFAVLVITSLIFYLLDDRTTMFSHEIQVIEDHVTSDCFICWIIFSFFETFIFLTFFLLISKTNLNPQVYIVLEIFLVALINYLYSLSMVLSFFKNGNNDFSFKDIINYIPIIYNVLIYFVVIALPFLYGVFNKTIIIYDLPGELCDSLYLFLTKEKCFDVFYNYLKTQRPEDTHLDSAFYLDLLISIFKFRLLVNNNETRELVIEEMNNIRNNYLNIIKTRRDNTFLDTKIVEEAIQDCDRGGMDIKGNIFDKIAGSVYEYLDKKFFIFKQKEIFKELQNELNAETNIRCKLTNFGLIRN